ncbi:PREDICTED: Fanconi anemia group I protein-like [Acropora digitifera]|uniref:Fanconi anemia group I protein-like n=1 Tax=Acropora digitifera TaxID=70779 RepID=UPI00077A33F9|nr:PREDICTED: Fanconi anemia group I protein-like [Acropora digitifera]
MFAVVVFCFADCGGEMAGQEYKRHLLNTLCSSRWDPQCAIHLAAIFRDIPMTPDELRFVIEKIIRAMKDLEIQELPPLVYQLLLLSTKGHKQLVLEGVTSFFSKLDKTCNLEGTDDRTCQTTPGSILTPFNIALGLSIAQIHRFEETIFEFLKSAVLRSFKDEERRKQSKWVREDHLLASTVHAAPHVLLESLPRVKEALDYLSFLQPKSAEGFLKAIQPLLKISLTLRDSLILVLRKAMFSRQVDARRIAVTGFLLILKHFKILGGVSSSQPSSQLSQPLLPSSQIQVDVHVRGNAVNNEALCLEILGNLRRCLTQQADVRMQLYEGLFHVLSRNPQLQQPILDMLNTQILGGVSSSSQPSSQLSQPLLPSSQIQVDVHVRGNAVSNEALCLEILGNLRRCLTQQADVRMQLYEGLFHVLSRNPQLQQPILDMLNTQFLKYVEQDEDINPPIRLEPCLSALKDQVYLTEPLGHLLCYLLHSLAKCVENHTQDEEGEHDSMEHILNELEDLFQSLVRRMNKSEMEDFELDKSADFSLASSVGIKNNIMALLVLGVYEVLLEYSFAEGELSTESAEEIVHLFGNFHQLSEILKEKAIAPGKKGRSMTGKQGTKTMLSLECSATMLRALFSDTAPSHQQGLTLLRASQPLIKYAINTTLQKLKEINDAGVCSGPGGSSKENICKLCCTIARIFWKHVNGESCLLEETEKKEKGKKINSLCVEGFCIVVNIMCCWFPQRLSHFICALDGTQESEKDSTDETVVQEILFAQIKKFQRLIVSIISSPDEDGDISLKECQSIVNVVSLLAHHLQPDGQQFTQLQSWAHRICTDHNVDDPVLTKCLMSLLYSLTFQSKTSASLVRDVAQDVHSQLGDVDPDLEVEDRTHFAIINPRTAAPTVAVRICHTVFVLLKYSVREGPQRAPYLH